MKEVLIWKSAQNPKASPGSRAKILQNSSEKNFSEMVTSPVRRHLAGVTGAQLQLARAIRTRVLDSRKRPKSGRRQGCLGGMLTSSGPRLRSSFPLHLLRKLAGSPRAAALPVIESSRDCVLSGREEGAEGPLRHIPFSSRRQLAKAARSSTSLARPRSHGQV